MYAAKEDLVVRFGDTEVADLGDDAAIAARLADAGAEIDAALYSIYVLPLPAGPWPLLRDIECAIARYRLYDDEVPDRVRNAAASARKRLRLLGEGMTLLVNSDGVAAPRRTQVQATAPTPALTRAALDDA